MSSVLKTIFNDTLPAVGECLPTPKVKARKVKAGDQITITFDFTSYMNMPTRANKDGWQIEDGEAYIFMTDENFKKTYALISAEKGTYRYIPQESDKPVHYRYIDEGAIKTPGLPISIRAELRLFERDIMVENERARCGFYIALASSFNEDYKVTKPAEPKTPKP